MSDSYKKFEETEGRELLKPFNEVKGSDQLRLISKLTDLGYITDGKAKARAGQKVDFDKLADLIDWVTEKFAVDAGKFESFTRGTGGYQRALDLVMAYAGLLGESEGSKS